MTPGNLTELKNVCVFGIWDYLDDPIKEEQGVDVWERGVVGKSFLVEAKEPQ